MIPNDPAIEKLPALRKYIWTGQCSVSCQIILYLLGQCMGAHSQNPQPPPNGNHLKSDATGGE